MSVRVRILGIGNVLMGDDALGPHVVRQLESAYEFGDEVEVREIGTPGLDLVPHIEGAETLVLIDTVRATGLPGDVRTYDRDEILAQAPQPRVSPHDPGLREALLTLEFAGRAPREVLLIGVIPLATKQGVGMSDAVRDAIPAVVREVTDELERLGAKPVPRAEPVAAEIWWEA